MTLREGAAHRVLARQADVVALLQQRGEGQALGRGPVDVLAAVDGLATALHDTLQRLVDVDVVGDLGQAVTIVLELGGRDGGVATLGGVVRLLGAQALPLAVQPVGLVGLEDLAGLELGVEEGLEAGDLGVDLGLGQDALGDQTLGVDLARRRLGADLRIHQRLGEGGIVAFVVAEAAVAEHVHHRVLVELLTVFRRHLGGEDDRFRVVAVDVEDRGLDHQRHIRRIGRRARVARAGGEADLVVDDEVQGAAGAVALQPHQGEALGHHALAGEGGVAVDQQGHDLGTVQHPFIVRLADIDLGLADVEGLLGARLAQDDRVDDFQVRRVGRQRQVDLLAVELAVRRGAHVVFDVARTFDVRGHGRTALELVEDGLVGLAHDGGERVQAAAVGHAEDDLVNAQVAAALDHLLQGRDHGLAAVQAEALGAGEALVQEAFKALGLDQLVQDGQLAFPGEGVLLELVRAFKALLQPGFLFRLGDVHVLHADVAAVGALEDLQHLTDRAGLQAQDAVQEDRAVHVGGGEAVEFGGQLGVFDRLLDTQRVQRRLQVAAHAVAADQHQGADRVMGGGAHVGGGQPARGVSSQIPRSGGRRTRTGLAGGGLGIDLGRRPAAVEDGGVLGRIGGGATAPRTGGGRLLHQVGVVLQLVEEGAPFPRHRAGVRGPFFVQVLNEGGVRAIEEAGLGKDLVQLTCIVRHVSLVVLHSAARARLRGERRRSYRPCFLTGHDRSGADRVEIGRIGKKKRPRTNPEAFQKVTGREISPRNMVRSRPPHG
ncbi:hypothetical protein D3C71_319130 [compost metagenome]